MEPLSQDEFAQEIQIRLQARYPELDITYNVERFSLKTQRATSNESTESYLGNHYKHYVEAHPENREAILNWIIKVAYVEKPTLPDSFAGVQSLLMPSVRDRVYPDSIQLRFEIDNQTLILPHLPIGDHLTLCLVVDSENHTSLVDETQLAKWGVSFENALEVAMKNLEAIPLTIVEATSGLYAIQNDDDYDATRLLLVERLTQNFPVQGQRVLMTPNRNLLLVADSSNEDSLTEMLRIATRTWQSSGGIHGFAAIEQNGWWQEWLPEPGSAIYSGFRELALQSLGQHYHDQKKLLDDLHERELVELFVASFMGWESAAGLLSICTWSQGVNTLLPQTDGIVFYQGDTETMLGPIPWQQVQERVGHLMEATELYPIRYRVQDFPNAEVLADLAKFTLDPGDTK